MPCGGLWGWATSDACLNFARPTIPPPLITALSSPFNVSSPTHTLAFRPTLHRHTPKTTIIITPHHHHHTATRTRQGRGESAQASAPHEGTRTRTAREECGHGNASPCLWGFLDKSIFEGRGNGSSRRDAKADSTLRCSQAVPHPSTNRALRRLTSEVGRDPVHSTRYGRRRHA